MFFISLPFSDVVYAIYMLITWVCLVFGITGDIQQKVTQERSVSYQSNVCSNQQPTSANKLVVFDVHSAKQSVTTTKISKNYYSSEYYTPAFFINQPATFEEPIREGFGHISSNRGPPHFC
jgi:hypothetical protein